MCADTAGDFIDYLVARKHIEAGVDVRAGVEAHDGQSKLRRLWQLTELTASDFADEVARFYVLSRVTLPQLLAATALVKHFSPRFLREMIVFPYQTAAGHVRLA